MKCSIASLTLHSEGKYDNLVYWVNINELLKIILNSFNKDSNRAFFKGHAYIWQEPITRSLQLPHIRVTAFSQTDLFLV